MGSSVYSSFLLSSVSSGRMTLKMIVVLCLALVVFIEANPVSMEVPDDDGWTDDNLDGRNTGILIDAIENNSIESEDTTEDSQKVEVMDPRSERKKRSPCFRNQVFRVEGRCPDGIDKWD